MPATNASRSIGAVAVALLAMIVGFGIIAGFRSMPEPTDDSGMPPLRSDLRDPPEPPPTPEPPELSVANGSSVVAIGDSWLDGIDAKDPASQSFIRLTADHFGWDLRLVAGNGGTGYVSYGNPPAVRGNYATRLALQDENRSVRLLILQGGINDNKFGSSAITYGVEDAIEMARLRFPRAELLVVGIASPSWPAGANLISLNEAIAEVAQREGVRMIDPIAEEWLAQKPRKLFTRKGPAGNHPNTKGHAEYAKRLIEAIEAARGAGD